MSKELKQAYIENECKTECNSEKWAKFLNSHYSDVIEISNKYFPIQKQKINKTFCFGVGMNASATSEEIEHGFEMEEHARTSVQYFLNENLEKIRQEIKELKYFLIDDFDAQQKYINDNNLRYRLNFLKCYICNKSICNDASVCFQLIEDDKTYLHKNIIRLATKEEMQKVIDALEEEKENFKKRLQTYLKRFGLSKVRTWSYIVD